MKNIFLPLVALLLLTFSCSSDDDTIYEEVVPLGAYENGILVSSEGGPSSISAALVDSTAFPDTASDTILEPLTISFLKIVADAPSEHIALVADMANKELQEFITRQN